MVSDELERQAESALLEAFTALKKPNPNHDAIRDRIAGAMASAQLIRSSIAWEAMNLRLGDGRIKQLKAPK